MQGLTLFNLNLTHLLDAFLETAVPLIAGLAEVVGLFIIITSLAKDPLVDELELKRLKKRKLLLKDMIAHLESKLIPDLNA